MRPPSTSDNTLLSAVQFAVPQGGLPGGITNVTWQLNLSTDTVGIGVKWKWAAAVYTSFSANYSGLGVKPVDDQKISQYQNPDHAGTPENYKSYVTGGATGSGGTNYVGLYSGTVTVSVPVVAAPAANAGGPYSGYAGQAISFNGTGSTDPDGYPLTYTWNFGDSNTGSGPTPSHAYSSAGTFTVTLTVSDGRNVTGTATTSATITLPPPPQISASQSPLPNANGWNNTSVSVTFTCVDSISGIYSCTPPLTVTSQGANQVVQGIAVNNAGESTTTSVKLNIDETAPTVTAVPAPPPNSNGWNNTSVAVSFSCSDSLSGVATCPSSQTVSAEGAGQTITGTATDNAGNSSSATVTLNIDHTSPVVSITSPANGAVFTSSAVTVSGTVSDALSGVGTLTCNGTMAVVSNGTFSCGLQMVSGSNAIQVQAVDLAGNSSNAAVTVTYNAVPPTELFITPTQASMLVGDVRTVNLVGQVGQLVSGATWNVSDPTVVSLSSDDPPQLTALAVGTTTLTASYGSLSATMTISVYTGTSLPAGTPIWSADPLPGNSYVVTIFPANPLNPGDPDLYSVEGNQTLRAFTVDGRQLWVSKITGPSTAAQSAQIAYASPVQAGELQGNPAPSTTKERLEVKPSFAPGSWGTGQHNPLERIEQSHLRLLQKAMRRRSNSLVRGMAVSTGSVGIASATTTASYTPYTIRAVPLNDGGMLALVFNYSQTSGSPNYDSLIKMNSSGQPVWQRDSAIPGNFGITPAVGPDDTVYAVEYFLTDMNTSNARVLALDGTTGASKFTDNLPPNQVTVNGSQTYPGPAAARLFETPLSVMPDGSLQFVFAKYDKDYTGNLEALPNGPYCPSFSCQYSVSEHDAVLLYQIQPDGTMGTIPISQYDFAQSGCLWTRNCETPYFGELWYPEGVIPDGQGGTLASWYDTTVVTSDATTGNKLTHFDTSGNSNAFTIPLQRTWGYTGETGQNLVLGENNTAFATDSVGVTAFDINSGITQWQWQPGSSDSISLLSANDPGGVTALDYDSNTGLLTNEIAFDLTGSSTITPLNSNLQSASPFYAAALPGISSTEQVELLAAVDFTWSTGPWDAVPTDRRSDPKVSLTLSVSSIYVNAPQDIQTNSSITMKVNNASNFWWTKAKIKLNWDGTIQASKSCDPKAYPNGCSGNPQLDIAELTSPTTAAEFVRRFCVAGLSPKCTNEGSQLVFNQDIGTGLGYTAFTGSTSSPIFMNISAIAAGALEDNSTGDSSKHDLSHELGHQFQLKHIGWSLPSNLMCTGILPNWLGQLNTCPAHAGGRLGSDQIVDIIKGAKQLQ